MITSVVLVQSLGFDTNSLPSNISFSYLNDVYQWKEPAIVVFEKKEIIWKTCYFISDFVRVSFDGLGFVWLFGKDHGRFDVTDTFPPSDVSRCEEKVVFQEKENVFELYHILYLSHKFLFKAITTFWSPLLLNLFKYILKVDYLSVWHSCSILCCSNLSDLRSENVTAWQ